MTRDACGVCPRTTACSVVLERLGDASCLQLRRNRSAGRSGVEVRRRGRASRSSRKSSLGICKPGDGASGGGDFQTTCSLGTWKSAKPSKNEVARMPAKFCEGWGKIIVKRLDKIASYRCVLVTPNGRRLWHREMLREYLTRNSLPLDRLASFSVADFPASSFVDYDDSTRSSAMYDVIRSNLQRYKNLRRSPERSEELAGGGDSTCSANDVRGPVGFPGSFGQGPAEKSAASTLTYKCVRVRIGKGLVLKRSGRPELESPPAKRPRGRPPKKKKPTSSSAAAGNPGPTSGSGSATGSQVDDPSARVSRKRNAVGPAASVCEKEWSKSKKLRKRKMGDACRMEEIPAKVGGGKRRTSSRKSEPKPLLVVKTEPTTVRAEAESYGCQMIRTPEQACGLKLNNSAEPEVASAGRTSVNEAKKPRKGRLKIAKPKDVSDVESERLTRAVKTKAGEKKASEDLVLETNLSNGDPASSAPSTRVQEPKKPSLDFGTGPNSAEKAEAEVVSSPSVSEEHLRILRLYSDDIWRFLVAACLLDVRVSGSAVSSFFRAFPNAVDLDDCGWLDAADYLAENEDFAEFKLGDDFAKRLTSLTFDFLFIEKPWGGLISLRKLSGANEFVASCYLAVFGEFLAVST